MPKVPGIHIHMIGLYLINSMKKLLLLLFLVSTAFGQQPTDFYATWLTATQHVHPALTGGFSVAHPLDKQDDYWFNDYNISIVRTPALTFQTTLTTGVATKLRQYGPVKIFAVVLGGVAVVNDSGGGAASGKILIDIPIKKSPWRLLLIPFNIDKTSTSPGTVRSIMVGFGRSF